jgi:DNA-binding CsgD family transcriptional regulator
MPSRIDDRGLLLTGRHQECAALDRLTEFVCAGRSQVLVVHGKPGIGKSALLDYVASRASRCRVVRAKGVEPEASLDYAGLHQLCAQALNLRERLPGPQHKAIATAFGLSDGPTPDRFVVGLAVLGLLRELAKEAPLVGVVDDAQWLDQASACALAFVARRLTQEPIGLVIALRENPTVREFSGLPDLLIAGLRASDARELLESALPGRMDYQVRDRIIIESQGNPMTLLEVARGVTSSDMAGGFALPDVMPIVDSVERDFVQRLEPLPQDTRRLLLVAATEPAGDEAVLWQAAGRLGIGVDAVAPAQSAGLIDTRSGFRFSHPLLRATVYRAASPTQRREAHRVLADATEHEADADRRAWHRAHALHGPNDTVAAELERSARAAAARGGVAAAAAFLGRAAELTPEPDLRGRRALAAARAKILAGGLEQATSILTAGPREQFDADGAAGVDLTRAQITMGRGHLSEAAPLLLAAARMIEQHDAQLARETYTDALKAAMFAGCLTGPSLLEVARAARASADATPGDSRNAMLDALIARLVDGDAAAVQLSRRAMRAICSDGGGLRGEQSQLWLMTATAADLWDEELWDACTARHVKHVRESGAVSELPLALTSRIYAHLFAGELAEAASLVREGQTVSEAMSIDFVPFGALGIAAWQGREDEFDRRCRAVTSTAGAPGGSNGPVLTHWTKATLLNGLSRYDDALVAARHSVRRSHRLTGPACAWVELVEAGVRSGAIESAAHAVERLSQIAGACGTDWALGVAARSKALLSDDELAEGLYCEAIERLDRALLQVDLARARLLYGEWLRRVGRRVHAREQLRMAQDMFEAMGMAAFAERTRRELGATGAKVRRRSSFQAAHEQLTLQEEQIVRLVREGLSNPEIGTRLFISGRTVEWHLRNVFTKLGISSRMQLIATAVESGAAWS